MNILRSRRSHTGCMWDQRGKDGNRRLHPGRAAHRPLAGQTEFTSPSLTVYHLLLLSLAPGKKDARGNGRKYQAQLDIFSFRANSINGVTGVFVARRAMPHIAGCHGRRGVSPPLPARKRTRS